MLPLLYGLFYIAISLCYIKRTKLYSLLGSSMNNFVVVLKEKNITSLLYDCPNRAFSSNFGKRPLAKIGKK